MEAGQPVLFEKPVTVKAERAIEIQKLAKQRKPLVAEAMWTRYMPLRKIIDDIIVGGIIGEERSLTATIGYQLSGVKRTWNVNLAGGTLRDVVRYLLSFAKMVFKTQITDEKATAQ